jgi:hypothetical protein
MAEWYEVGDYDGTSCWNCGRERVMACEAPDGTEHRVCEKCNWDHTDKDYVGAMATKWKAIYYRRVTPRGSA